MEFVVVVKKVKQSRKAFQKDLEGFSIDAPSMGANYKDESRTDAEAKSSIW